MTLFEELPSLLKSKFSVVLLCVLGVFIPLLEIWTGRLTVSGLAGGVLQIVDPADWFTYGAERRYLDN